MAIMEAIATTYLEADAASVTFDDIPSTYDHLQVRISARDTSSASHESVYLQLGDTGHSPVDTGTNYSRCYMYGAGSNAGFSGVQTSSSDIWLGKIAAASFNSGSYGYLIIDILDYANANKNTSVLGRNGSGTGTYVRQTLGLWDDTSVVNAVLIKGNGNVVRGTELTLYGIKNS
tara:strand:- start:543 stop:1067 length:525 start_codon:yes stop_codon:yes gene_type:complete